MRYHGRVALESQSVDSVLLEMRHLEERLRDKDDAIACALSALVDLKDLHTGIHATRMAEWAVRIGRVLGLEPDELRDLELASLLHDIGKIGIPDAILLKPGGLNEEELEIVRRHPEYAWAVLRMIPGFDRVALLALHHHERMDGRGYPAGLADEAIPLGARIVAVIDAFDAMMSSRSYRGPLRVQDAVDELIRCSGSQWDPRVVRLFIAMAAEEFNEVFDTVGGVHSPELPTD